MSCRSCLTLGQVILLATAAIKLCHAAAEQTGYCSIPVLSARTTADGVVECGRRGAPMWANLGGMDFQSQSVTPCQNG